MRLILRFHVAAIVALCLITAGLGRPSPLAAEPAPQTTTQPTTTLLVIPLVQTGKYAPLPSAEARAAFVAAVKKRAPQIDVVWADPKDARLRTVDLQGPITQSVALAVGQLMGVPLVGWGELEFESSQKDAPSSHGNQVFTTILTVSGNGNMHLLDVKKNELFRDRIFTGLNSTRTSTVGDSEVFKKAERDLARQFVEQLAKEVARSVVDHIGPAK